MTSPLRVRPTAVAGTFYPAGEEALRRALDDAFRGARHDQAAGPAPKAIIAPHAGYVYSGPVAATAYERLAPDRDVIRRIVLLGPSHRVPLRGMAVPSTDLFDSPLGAVAVDAELRDRVLALPGVGISDEAHAGEHSLEVHLPFLQRVLAEFTVLPLVVGVTPPETVAGVLDAVWGGPETRIVVSSDLSHYHDHDTATRLDARTAEAIVAGRLDAIADDDACGAYPVRGLLAAAARRGLRVEALDLRTSGDTAGPRDRVVGYGAFALDEGPGRGGDSLDAAAKGNRVGNRAASGLGDGALAETSSGGAGGAPGLHADTRDFLLDVALRSIARGFQGLGPLPVDRDQAPPGARHRAGAFVTVTVDGELNGCIGTIEPVEALVTTVARCAWEAAFDDPRLPPLEPSHLDRAGIEVSVLSPLEPLGVWSEEELVAALRPGVDGLVIDGGGRRATFLPAVWEQVADAVEFVHLLERKAGLRPGDWPRGMRAWRYTSTRFGYEALTSRYRRRRAG